MHDAHDGQETNRKLLELHNLPTMDWLKEANAIAGRCDLNEHYDYDTDEITVVTTLLDLGRGSTESGSFIRPMTEYYRRLQVGLCGSVAGCRVPLRYCSACLAV